MVRLFDERDNFLTEIAESDALRLVREGKARRRSEGKGRRKRQSNSIKLLPPPPPPSDSPNSVPTITLSEMEANAGLLGSRAYQSFARAKVYFFGIPSWRDCIRTVPATA